MRRRESPPSPITHHQDGIPRKSNPLYYRPQKVRKFRTKFRTNEQYIQMNLSYAEMYVMIAGIFRKYDLYDRTGKQTGPTLELFETGRGDVDMAADYFTAYLKPGSQGVRVIVR